MLRYCPECGHDNSKVARHGDSRIRRLFDIPQRKPRCLSKESGRKCGCRSRFHERTTPTP